MAATSILDQRSAGGTMAPTTAPAAAPRMPPANVLIPAEQNHSFGRHCDAETRPSSAPLANPVNAPSPAYLPRDRLPTDRSAMAIAAGGTVSDSALPSRLII